MRNASVFGALLVCGCTVVGAQCDLATNPLDCIQVLDPNLGKEIVWGPAQTHCGDEQSLFWFVRSLGFSNDSPAGGSGFDAAGNFYTLDNYLGAREVFRYTPAGQRTLIAVGDASADTNGMPDGLSVDINNGRLYLSMSAGGCTPGTIIALTGLPKLFDVFESYIPTTTGLIFSVPAMPEGLPSADHFDTYWGNVASLPDFSKAQPMACGYPASPPAVGDVLSILDTSPTPPRGQANYIVTAVTHGADRRYGRQLTGPTMTGRNPALLSACPSNELFRQSDGVQAR